MCSYWEILGNSSENILYIIDKIEKHLKFFGYRQNTTKLWKNWKKKLYFERKLIPVINNRIDIMKISQHHTMKNKTSIFVEAYKILSSWIFSKITNSWVKRWVMNCCNSDIRSCSTRLCQSGLKAHAIHACVLVVRLGDYFEWTSCFHFSALHVEWKVLNAKIAVEQSAVVIENCIQSSPFSCSLLNVVRCKNCKCTQLIMVKCEMLAGCVRIGKRKFLPFKFLNSRIQLI